MSTEAGLWKWLRDHVPQGHWVRLENSIGLGTPDVTYKVLRGSEGWIELKHCDDDCGPEAIPFKRKGLRKEQVFWIEDRVAAGGLVWIVAGIGKTVYFVHGTHAAAFNLWTRERLHRHASLVVLRGSPLASEWIARLFSQPA